MNHILEEIKAERRSQIEKWGEQDHSPIEWMAILTEEVGEASKEAVDHHFLNEIKALDSGRVVNEVQTNRLRAYRKELIQVAAVAVSMIESLERNELEYEK